MPTVRQPLEKDIQSVCLQWLRLKGAFPIRTNSGAVKVGSRFVRFNSEPGCSDCLVCLPGGRFLACEFKRPGNSTTEAQAAFLDAVRAAGGLAFVVVGLDDLRRQLEAAGFTTEPAIRSSP